MIVVFKMVGVLFVILIVSTTCLAKSKECPEICECLGSFVDCSSKNLERLISTTPKWATHLDMHNNQIKNLGKNKLKNLTALTELNLNKNFIHTIQKDCFANQQKLQNLELNRNNLTSIEALTFQNLVRLKTLKLKRNRISQLYDGAFYGLQKIEKLLLDYNEIRVISKRWLYGLTNLRELTLSHNNISTIEEGDTWEFSADITYLDLSYNQLKSIENDAFKNLGHLEKLVLNNNNIKYIKEDAFQHLPRLKVLDLHNNEVWWTIEDGNVLFRGLNDLIKFNLSGNLIKSINKNAFIGLKNVTHINLNHNNISSIQEDSFSEVPMLKELVLNTTSAICDCNIKWLVEWVKVKGVKINVQCAYPEHLLGESLFNVSLSNLTCDKKPIPRLIEKPDEEIMALKGENVSLSCQAASSSSSIMTFQWKKNNMEITDAEIINNSTRSDKNTYGTSVLNLRWVNNSHAGKYQCVVSNKFGTTYSRKSTISVLVFPTFIKSPTNITVNAGETARFECAANGEPQPEIGWRKDGGNDFPAARERRMQYMLNDDVFFILNVRESDMGVYSCTAHNAAGTNIANASLIIEEKPSFVKVMEDKEVIAGTEVALKCLASGRPKPTITWLKDGKALTATERHFFTAESQLMIIVDTVISDSGIYECHLSNRLGEVSGRSMVVVKPAETYSSSSRSNIMGIIIITVVCCAVLTSIVWVVIIYQTRKRPSMPTSQLSMELKEMSDYRDKAFNGSGQATALQLRHFPDNVSEHSSCKDSGTGDSAKRSSDDLVPDPDDFAMVINETTMAPLLHYPRSTNHDRREDSHSAKDV